MHETTHSTRAPEGSIDALAKALGLIADPTSEALSSSPWIVSEAPMPRPIPVSDPRVDAMETRLTSLEKTSADMQTKLSRAEDWQVRMEKSFGLLQETLRTEFQTASRIVLGAAGGLAVVIFVCHWL